MKPRCCAELDLKTTSKILKTISEDNRLVIVCLLKEKERCVCEIQEALRAPHNLVIHHLNKLKAIQLITSKNIGKYTFYMLNQNIWKEFIKSLAILFGTKKGSSNGKK